MSLGPECVINEMLMTTVQNYYYYDTADTIENHYDSVDTVKNNYYDTVDTIENPYHGTAKMIFLIHRIISLHSYIHALSNCTPNSYSFCLFVCCR